MHHVRRDRKAHFKVVMVADVFEGERLIARHRRVNAVLADELAIGVHALALHTYTESEWRARFGAAPLSPPCRGGARRIDRRPMNVATFYRFVSIDDPRAVAARVHDLRDAYALRGTVLVAREGINGTLDGRRRRSAFVDQLEGDPRFAQLPVRCSTASPQSDFRSTQGQGSRRTRQRCAATSIRRGAARRTRRCGASGIDCSIDPT